MNKKFLVLFIIILLGLTVLSAFTLDNDDDYLDLNRSTLNISAGGYPVDYFVESLNKEEYYRGHDEKTKLWLIGLSGNQVYSSGDYYVVMGKRDADKLHYEDATDVIITDFFTCEIIENRSLGEGLKDVLYVRNVEFIDENIESLEV